MDENIVNEAEFAESENDNETITIEEAQKELDELTKPKLLDRIADYLGLILGLLVTTGCAAVAFAFFITFIPSINFTFVHFLKCWSGMIAIILIKGLIKTKV